MHLEGPWLSTTGKKKGKRKFRNADEAKKARLLAEEWDQLLKKYQPDPKTVKSLKNHKPLPAPKTHFRGMDDPRPPSLPFTGGACTKPAPKIYTGDKIKGIGTMHKSNAVPIFTDEEAIDIAKMRR